MLNLNISKRAKIGEEVLLGNNVTIYGETIIGDHAIIEDNVVLGHPGPNELKKVNKQNFNLLFDYYDSANQSRTVIGEKAVIRSNTILYSGCKIGTDFDCGHNAIIRENCTVDDHVYIFVNTELKGNVNIGKNCRIGGTLCERTLVGDFSSMLGHTVHKYLVGTGGYSEPAPQLGKGVIVGRETVLIGEITIGDFSIIGANSILSKSVEELSIYAGSPAAFIRKRSKNEIPFVKEITG